MASPTEWLRPQKKDYSPMLPRERWQAVLEGRKPDRIPCDYWATPEVTERLMRDLECATERALWETLGIDRCVYIAPHVNNPQEKPDGVWSTGVWNIGMRTVTYGDGLGAYEEAVEHPLAHVTSVSDVERYAWPNPEWWDLSDYRQRCMAWRNFPILGGQYEPFFLYCWMRGMEQAMEDLVANPDILEAALEHIFDIHEAVFRKTLDVAADLIDVMEVSEDLGSQSGLLIPPDSFRRLFKPRMARMVTLAHSYGVKVFCHSDGAIRPYIADLIEIGVDMLNPVQWRCAGMDREGLVKDFGSALIFHGAVDNQQTLPFGTPDDVRREVRENIDIFANARGHIVAPCHNIQPNTPTANIIALYETVRDHG